MASLFPAADPKNAAAHFFLPANSHPCSLLQARQRHPSVPESLPWGFSLHGSCCVAVPPGPCVLGCSQNFPGWGQCLTPFFAEPLPWNLAGHKTSPSAYPQLSSPRCLFVLFQVHMNEEINGNAYINQLLIFYPGDCFLQGNIYLNIVIGCSQPVFLQVFIRDTSNIYFTFILFFFFVVVVLFIIQVIAL